MKLEIKSSGHLLELLAQQFEGHWQGTRDSSIPHHGYLFLPGVIGFCLG